MSSSQHKPRPRSLLAAVGAARARRGGAASHKPRPRSLLAAAGATYGTNAAAALLSLVNVLIVARALGPTGRGQVAFLIAVGTLSAHFASLSIQESNANLGGRFAHLRGALLTNSLLFALALGAAASLAVEGLVHAVPAIGGHVPAALLWVALGSIPVLLVKSYLQYLLQSDYRFTVTNLAWLAGPTTTFTVNTTLAVLGEVHVGSAIVAWVGGQCLGTALMVVYAARHFGVGRPSFSLALQSARFGAKAYVGRLMEVGNYRMDQWLMGAMVGPRDLGLYSIAVAWAEMLYYVPGVIVLVARPDLVRATAQRAGQKAASLFRRVAFLTSGAALGLIVAAPILCKTVFGARFAGSVDELRVLSLGALGIAALELCKTALTAQRKPMLGSAAVGSAFLVTLVLDLTLIPTYSGMGASIATAAAYSAGGVVAAVLLGRALHVQIAELIPRVSDLRWFWQRGLQLRTVALGVLQGRG